MRPSSPNEAAKLISRALISASNRSTPTRSWSPSLEHTVHQLCSRDSLNPSLLARIIDPFLLNHHSLALGLFNWASQQPGFSHTPLTYQSVLKSLSLSRQFNSLEKLLKQIKTQKIPLHPSIYRSVIASLVLSKRTHSAFLVFNDIRDLSHEIGHDICNSLVAALASDGYLDSANKLFDEMRVRRISWSTLGFGVFIGRFCGVSALTDTLRMIDEVKRGVSTINGSVVAVLIVDGLCRESRVSEASGALEELRVRGWKPDFMAYRIVAEAFRVMGQSEESEKVLKRKRKFGVAPRSDDYKEFLLNLISERRIREAKELGQVIVSGDFPIDEDVLNVLIGSASAIDTDSAILFFKCMVGKENLPSVLTLSNLSRNLCKNGKTEELVEVYRSLSSMGYFLDMERYNVMISFLCTAGRVREAYGALQEMRENGFSPDVFSYNSIMEACCREDLLRPARRLWDEMFAHGCPGNLKTYNILIRKFSQTGDVEEACNLFNHMLEKGVTPDSVSYTSILEGLCWEGNIEAACDILKRSIEQDIVLAQSLLPMLIHYLCKEGKSLAVSRVIRSLPSDFRDHECHVVLLKGLVDGGEMESALEHLQWIAKNSPSILKLVSAELVTSLSSASKPEPVLQLIRVMMEEGLVPHNDTWMELCDDLSFRKC